MYSENPNVFYKKLEGGGKSCNLNPPLVLQEWTGERRTEGQYYKSQPHDSRGTSTATTVNRLKLKMLACTRSIEGLKVSDAIGAL